jgi:hypothetical protein
MKKLSLLLLDANVVIYLFELGMWDKLVQSCGICLARTVVAESAFFEDEHGKRHDIDLNDYIATNAVNVFDAQPQDMKAFLERFDPVYLEKLDAGEAESLCCLLTATDEMRICSADKIVFRVLGNLDRSEQGLSLEEAFDVVGLRRGVKACFGKAYRQNWTRKGVEERLQGLGTKVTKRR